MAIVFIIFARWANLSVESVYGKESIEELIVAIMLVLELPLNESLRKKVSLLSL